jgi:hypothetical protein
VSELYERVDVEFLHSVIKTYSSCEGDYSKLAEKIAQFNGGYTLVAKYAGLWLRSNGCKVKNVESAVEEAKKEPKLFLARYIWHVLLKGRGDLARKAAVPLLLHAYFGPVPVGLTYVTKAVYHGVWRFLKPEKLKSASLESLREDELEPIAKWLAQKHEDLVEEMLRDLAGLNGEEARKPYKETLSDLIKALDRARDEVLKEGGKILAELDVPEDDRGMENSLLAFVGGRLAAVFKSGEVRHCWKRVALIVGHALAGYHVLPKREQLPEDVAEALGDALKPCAVDAYLTIDGEMPPLSIYVARLMLIRELNILSPLADTETIDDARKTAEELLVRWRRGDITPPEIFYALGLAALAAKGEVDEETVDLLLYATPFAVQRMTHPGMVLPLLAALRPLGEKAPHRYVSLLAAASGLTLLDQGTTLYIYLALQQLEDRLTETGRIWPLVETVHAYSNLVRGYPEHIKSMWKGAANMCRLYDEVRKRCAEAAPGVGLSAQRLLDTVARAYVLATALYSDELAQVVQRYCGLGDLIEEAEAVKGVLDTAATHLDELRKIMESDADFAEWVTVRDITGDVGFVIENVRGLFTYLLAHYKLSHALDEKGELDAEKLEEVAEEFEKVAEMHRKLKGLENYLTARGRALRTRVIAAKSWEELLERAKGFQVLWKEAEEHLKLTAEYLATAAHKLGEYLVYLAASDNKEEAVKLLKERRWLLNYRPEVSVNTRLMLRFLGVGEGAKLEEVVDVFKSLFLPEFQPALSMLAGRLQRDEAHKECGKLFSAKPSEAKRCDIIVATAAGDRVAAEILRSVIEKVAPEARPLLDRADGKTLVEVLAPIYSSAQLAFMLLAAVEGRADAVRLHGPWGTVQSKKSLLLRLSRAVYENCGDLDSEGCRMALLKLYYYHI